jgi:hypothetical protein
MLQSPFTAIVSGASGTGKTEWIKKLIRHKETVIKDPPIHILYCYGEINPEIVKLKTEGVELFHGVPRKEDIIERPKNLLLILDDLITDIDPKFLELLYTRGSHHWDISIITVTQNLFDKNIKIARINSHYIILMRNPQGLLQIKTLSNHLFPGKTKYFMESYNDAVESKPYGYLMVNMHPNISDELKLTTNIFPGEQTIIYLPL